MIRCIALIYTVDVWFLLNRITIFFWFVFLETAADQSPNKIRIKFRTSTW